MRTPDVIDVTNTPVGLVPVRANSTAKRRLAHVLRARERMDLIRRCYEHVVGVLGSAGIEVVTLAPHHVEVPDGSELWPDRGEGLNSAIGHAVAAMGAPVLVVHADLPWLQGSDVERVLEAPGDVVVARAHDGGTNGLLLRKLIRPAFGPSSALRHAALSRAASLRATVIDTPGFERDLDDEVALSAWTSSSWLRLP